MSEQGDLVLSRATHNFGIFRKSGKRAIFQIDFLCHKIKVIQRGSVKYIYDFDQLVQYDSEEGLSISVKLGHKELEFDAANTEEKLTICSLLGIVKGGEVTSQQVQQAEKPEVEDAANSIKRRAASVIKEGVLEKKGHAAIQVWSKRRVRISPGELSYFKPDEEIALNIVQLTPEKYMMKPSGNNGFVLIISDRKYHFRIPAEFKNINVEQTRDDWISAFNQACCQRRKTVLLLERGIPNVSPSDMQPSSDFFHLPRPCSDPDFNSGTGIAPAKTIHLSQTSIEEEPSERLSQIIQKTELLENVTKYRPKKIGKGSQKSRKMETQQSTDHVTQNNQSNSEESSDASWRSDQADSSDRESQRSTSSSGKSAVSLDFQEINGSKEQKYSVNQLPRSLLTKTESDQLETDDQVLTNDVHREWLSPEDEPDRYDDGENIYENVQACRAHQKNLELHDKKDDKTNVDASIDDEANGESDSHITDDKSTMKKPKQNEEAKVKNDQIKINTVDRDLRNGKDGGTASPNKDMGTVDNNNTFEQIREKFNVSDTTQVINTPNTEEQNQSTNVPEAPPPPPSLPPPPPPVGQHGERKYRTLHWTPISKAQLKGSIWKATRDLTMKLDEKLLQENFSIQKHSAMKFHPDQDGLFDEKKVLLDSRRARNLAIILNGLKSDKACSIHDILNSVTEDDSFPAEKLTTIRRYQPTSDDIEVYKLYADRREMLDPVDQFMYELCEIQCLGLRLDFVLLLWDFPRQLKCSTQAVERIMAACDQLLTSQQLVGVLGYILAIGNYLASKNNDEKGCVGFKISSLGKFIEMRGRSADCTFLHVLAEQLKEDTELQGWTEKLACVHDCEGLSVPAVSTEIEVLRCDLTTLKKNLKILKSKLKKPTDKERDFFNTAQTQLLEMESTVNKLDKMGSQVQTKYRRTMEYFGESTNVSSTEFFGAISEFVRKFDLAVQDNATRKKRQK